MGFLKLPSKKAHPSPFVKGRKPFDERHNDLIPLAVVMTIVPRHQETYFLDAYSEIGAPITMVLYAYSQPPVEILSYLGADQTKKTTLLTVCRAEYVPAILKAANARFQVSKEAKGVAFSLPVNNVAGILAYKFLSDYYKTHRTSNQPDAAESTKA